jgi:hypothetical protein
MAIDVWIFKVGHVPKYFIRIHNVAHPQGGMPSLLLRGVVSSGVKAGPLTKAEARKFVLDVWARVGRENFGVPVQIVSTVSELPADLQANAIAQGWKPGGGERFYGAFHTDGKVYIVAAEHNSAKQIEETVYHEVYGHAALNTLYAGNCARRWWNCIKSWVARPVCWRLRPSTASAIPLRTTSRA